MGYTYVLIIIVGLSNIFYCSFSDIAKLFSFLITLSFLIILNGLCEISLIYEIILHIFFFVVCFYINFQKDKLQTLQFTKFKLVIKKCENMNSILEGMSSIILSCENENRVFYNTNFQDLGCRNIEETEIVKNELDQRSRSMTTNNNGILQIFKIATQKKLLNVSNLNVNVNVDEKKGEGIKCNICLKKLFLKA